MRDQRKICIQCENEFVITAAEQERLASKGFDIPKRCPECRKKKTKAVKENDSRSPREKRRHEKLREGFFS